MYEAGHKRIMLSGSDRRLADKYWAKVKNNVWSLLQETLGESHDFLGKIIAQHQKLDPVLLSDLQNLLRIKLEAT